MAIYLTGSLAYDRLMKHPGRFRESVLPEQVHNLNVSFFIDQMEEKLGGTAGNIAYSLFLLGEKATIVAAVGRDFDIYRTCLDKMGLSCAGISELPDELTASCYIVTDEEEKQITAFHAAALNFPSSYAFPDINPQTDLGIICATNPDDMRAHPRLYKEKGVKYIYDPSQQLPILSKDDVLEAIDGCYLLIGNAYEIGLIESKTGKSRHELLEKTEAGIITTLSENGSLITHRAGGRSHIAVVTPQKVVNPTGAGDAYRAGLIKGLVQGWSLVKSACLGSACAAYCIEFPGTQEHSFTYDEACARAAEVFGSLTS